MSVPTHGSLLPILIYTKSLWLDGALVSPSRFNNCRHRTGQRVLDVGCGTGTILWL